MEKYRITVIEKGQEYKNEIVIENDISLVKRLQGIGRLFNTTVEKLVKNRFIVIIASTRKWAEILCAVPYEANYNCCLSTKRQIICTCNDNEEKRKECEAKLICDYIGSMKVEGEIQELEQK